jgi:hypothetical protein
MPSRALGIRESTQRAELDRLEAARTRGPARQQISDACIVLLAAHFQAFCRELHTEAAEAIAASTPHMDLVKRAFVLGRQLDRGNATPGALGADFGRLGIDLRPALNFQLSSSALATVAGTRRSLAFVRSCCACCEVLARQFDAVVEMRLWGRLGRRPW